MDDTPQVITQKKLDQISERIGHKIVSEFGPEIGFVVALVAPPIEADGMVVDQPFAMSSNGDGFGSVLGLLARAVENLAEHYEAFERPRIIAPPSDMDDVVN